LTLLLNILKQFLFFYNFLHSESSRTGQRMSLYQSIDSSLKLEPTPKTINTNLISVTMLPNT